MSFYIDTEGKSSNESKIITLPSTKVIDSENEDLNEEVEPPAFVHKIFEIIRNSNSSELKPPEPQKKTVNKNDIDLEETYKTMGWTRRSKKNKGVHGLHKVGESALTNAKELDKVLEKSVIKDDFETKHSITPSEQTKKKLKKDKKKEREKTKGAKWYGLPATEVTDEIKNDLEVLQMRSVLDPKHFYKKNDMKVLPKYFQIGKVQDSHVDFYNGRLTKKERKRTLVDELMADAEFTKYNKRKFREIQVEKQKTDYVAFKQARRLNKKKRKMQEDD